MAKRKRMEDSENKPVAEFRVNAVKAVVWKNESNDKVYYNTTLVRIYTDKDDAWKETHSLGRDDLMAARKALDEAHSFILESERAKARDAA